MKKEFLILLVQFYQDVIKVTMNITVVPCLHFFKPWWRGLDLKDSVQASWDDTFNKHDFRNQEVQLMKIFNICYECLNARDDYRAQLKNGIDKYLEVGKLLRIKTDMIWKAFKEPLKMKLYMMIFQ